MGTPTFPPRRGGDEQQPLRIVVVTGSAPLHPRAVAAAAAPEGWQLYVIAADGGLDHALAAGLRPALLVGDLDSVSPAGRAWAEAEAAVVAHDPDKDETDTELAIGAAVALAPRWLTLLAGAGDRLDHTIAAVGALGAPATAPVGRVDGWWGDQELHVAVPGRAVTFERPPGTTFSVLALHGPCRGVSVAGAAWPLDDAELAPVAGLGVSNTVADGAVAVAVSTTDGVLTVVVQPDPSPHRQEQP